MPHCRRVPSHLLTVTLLTVFLSSLPGWAADTTCALRWRKLHRGVTYSTAPIRCGGPVPALDKVKIRDKKLHIVRVDPAQVKLKVLMASARDKKTRTAARWAKAERLSVVINLGMYGSDHSTHVGFLRSGGHVNSKRWVADYQSILVIKPGAALLDRGTEEAKDLKRFDTVVQNLRLIQRGRKGQGEGVWSEQKKRWSEAAVAMDDRGRLLFLFNRAPLSMWELNRLLLKLPLGIVRAMHMEGGPEASLSIHAGGVNLDLCGSFETGFVPDDSNSVQWPLPNVLGVARP
jgi:hypothetical protein